MDKPYLIGRATAIVERLVEVPSDFVALVQVNPLQKLTYHLKEALKTGDEELIEIANAIGEIQSPFVDPKAQFYIGYYHQKSEFDNIAFRIHIGQKIAQIRKKRGLTQEQVSKMTGLDRTNIAKVENGKYNVSIDILQKICTSLNAEILIKAAE